MKKFLLMASITSILSISQLSLASPSGITIPGNYENIEQDIPIELVYFIFFQLFY